jgi:hypothetical protein
MIPYHKAPKWRRLLGDKGVNVNHWQGFRQGWPKAWAAQTALLPVLDVLFRTSQSRSRDVFGKNLAYYVSQESVVPVKAHYGSEYGPYEIRVKLYHPDTDVTETFVAGCFQSPLPPSLLTRLTSLWKSVQRLWRAPEDWDAYLWVVTDLSRLEHPDHGSAISRTLPRVLTSVRGLYAVPRLT